MDVSGGSVSIDEVRTGHPGWRPAFLGTILEKLLILRGGDSRAAVRGLTNPSVAASTSRFRHLPIAWP